MTSPLEGLKVVEVANWVAGPAACALFRDMGAEVLKIEPPSGDALRAFRMRNLGYDTDLNTAFELDHRGLQARAIGAFVELEHGFAADEIARLAADGVIR